MVAQVGISLKFDLPCLKICVYMCVYTYIFLKNNFWHTFSWANKKGVTLGKMVDSHQRAWLCSTPLKEGYCDAQWKSQGKKKREGEGQVDW